MSDIKLTQIGRFDPGLTDEGGAEINAYDPISQRLFVINGVTDAIDVLDLSDPSNPTFSFSIDITNFGGGVNSVAVQNGLLAAAVENDNSQASGQVVFFDTDGNVLNSITNGDKLNKSESCQLLYIVFC